MSHKLMICSTSLFILTAFSSVNALAEPLGSLNFTPKTLAVNCGASINCNNEDVHRRGPQLNNNVASSSTEAFPDDSAGSHAAEPGDAGTEPSEPSTPTF